MKLSSEYGTRHMLSNSMLKEHEIKVGNVNKVTITPFNTLFSKDNTPCSKENTTL